MCVRFRLAALAFLLAGSVSGPATAVPALEMRFDVEVRGLRAGVLALHNIREGGQYAASARLESTGVAALLRRIRFDAGVQGRVEGERLRPIRYREDVDTGRRESRTEIEYVRGVPRVVLSEPERSPEPWHLDPATQGGTLDPLSVMLSVLADVAPEAACRLDLAVFDGRRRTQIVLSEPVVEGQRVVCTGEVRRIAGYSEDDLAEARAFPFRLSYAPAGNGMLQVVEIEARSQHGRARLTRR
mgnify:CR=1 FL=1